MSQADIQFPKVNYGPENKEQMDELVLSEWSPFFGKDRADVFIFCMSYAYARGLEPKSITGSGTMPASAFDVEKRHLMRSLAISVEGNITIIKDSRKYVTICEEYAYAAFERIYKQIRDAFDNGVKTENILYDIINEVQRERS